MPDITAFYSQPTGFTSPGSHARALARLPADLAALTEVAQGLIGQTLAPGSHRCLIKQARLSRLRAAADRDRRPGARGDIADRQQQPGRRAGARGALGGRVGSRRLAVRGTGNSRVVVHIGHEPVTPAMDRLDDPLISAGVANSAAGGLDPAGQRRLGDEPVTPDLVEELGLRHDSLAMAQQIGQHIENLRLHADDLAGASQLDALDTQLTITESNPHVHHRAPWTP